ncbi:MAG: nucleotidyl transferase AbiEii/AbiGii toxin family protein [Nocardioidaceae bacterium]|nr:nucleotidyl transferase AbiEii/AbiGii toxin family protein [Nocardioidaceae bacterium]
MSRAEEIFRELQRLARSEGRVSAKPTPTAAYLIRHGLESFLARLAQTEYADDFILKGGILIGAYGVRRPTKDVDAEAVSASVTPLHIERVIRDIAAIDADDGLVFDLDSMSVEEIREAADYPGLRMRVRAALGAQQIGIVWDISTGDPIVPTPRKVRVERVIGQPVEMLGYAPETIIAEKGVTILERGTTSTRWRDYIDIAELPRRHDIDNDELLASALAVARYRRVELRPIAPVVAGYADTGDMQAKWSAWRRKEGVEDISEANLDDQMSRVAEVLDPVFSSA